MSPADGTIGGAEEADASSSSGVRSPPVAPEDGGSTWSEQIGARTVTDAAVASFGQLTGDYAQMHFDLDFGPSHGMGTPIAHGLLSAAWSLGALTLEAPLRLGVGNLEMVPAAYRVRFARPVAIGGRFSLRWAPAAKGEAAPEWEALASETTLDTRFEMLDLQGAVTGSGAVSVRRLAAPAERPVPPVSRAPEPIEIEAWDAEAVTEPLFADDFLERGPRGVSLGRTVTEAEIAAYAGFSGELNPLSTNREFARSGPFGARIASPMFTFALGFGDYVRTLLSAPMPSAGFAGHLGDAWRFFAPVHVGDTLRVRHRPVACRPSGSRPGMAIVEFLLQLQNQRDEIVQDGRVWMMMPMRGPA